MRAPGAEWRLVIDPARCDGHGVCALLAPERVHLDEWGYASVASDPLTRITERRHARAAVAACPAGALSVKVTAVARRNPPPAQAELAS